MNKHIFLVIVMAMILTGASALRHLHSEGYRQASHSSETRVMHSPNISPDELAQLEASFKSIDTDKNGKLSPDELTKAVVALRIPDLNQGDAKDIFKNVDTDNNGFVDLKEYITNLT